MSLCALITGITGQDGSYLAEFLIAKGYDVHGIMRRSSTINTERIRDILTHPRLTLHEGDVCDTTSIQTILQKVSNYDRIEIYNLAAQSHVHTSFRQPEYTANVDALGPLRILESIRTLRLESKTRFYQASTSELYGKVVETPQSETTPFYPRSPYAVAKMYAFWIVKNYRESYGMFACNGILFNHESERRGSEFVTRKITLGVNQLYKDSSFVLEMGNLDTRRDWGYAPDYVEGMWRILQHETPVDFVLATGETHSVREFIEEAFQSIGKAIRWEGTGVDERGYDGERLVVRVNPDFYRPAEVDTLVGNTHFTRNTLGWQSKITFKELVYRMVKHDWTN